MNKQKREATQRDGAALAAELYRGKALDVACHELCVDEESGTAAALACIATMIGRPVYQDAISPRPTTGMSVYQARQEIIDHENARRRTLGKPTIEEDKERFEREERARIIREHVGGLEKRIQSLANAVLEVRSMLVDEAPTPESEPPGREVSV